MFKEINRPSSSDSSHNFTRNDVVQMGQIIDDGTKLIIQEFNLCGRSYTHVLVVHVCVHM